MKKFYALLFAMTMAVASYAQWTYVGPLMPPGIRVGANGVHGVTTSPDGKIWVAAFTSSDSIIDATSGLFRACRAIHVFNRDGSPAAFSPIKTILVGAVRDTFYGTSGFRGIRADHQGNILIAWFDALYRVNYQTGVGMNKIVPHATGASTTAPGVNSLGEIFIARVAGGAGPIKIFASNFSSLGSVVDTSQGFSRSLEVSADGNDVYFSAYTTHRVLRYHSDFGSFGPYVVGPNDTLFKGFDCESIGWAPAKGTRPRLLWASAGSDNDLPNRYPGVTTSWSKEAWYAWNPATNAIVDSFKWQPVAGRVGPRPRGIAFSVTGDTAYVGCFNIDTVSVQVFRRNPTSVQLDPNFIPSTFELSQNYPNPFNPSTEIKFTLMKSGFTTLKVYDMLGREVATLVNENLGVGAFKTTLDASNLTSGTYLYRLTTNGQSIAKKMMLVK